MQDKTTPFEHLENEGNEDIQKIKEEKWRVYSEYGIPPNPDEWTAEQASSWFRWLCESCSADDCFSDRIVEHDINGKMLSVMNGLDFCLKFSTKAQKPDIFFHQYLQLWRTVPPFTFEEDVKPTFAEKYEILTALKEEKDFDFTVEEQRTDHIHNTLSSSEEDERFHNITVPQPTDCDHTDGTSSFARDRNSVNVLSAPYTNTISEYQPLDMSTTSPVSRCVEKMPFYSDFNMSSVVGHFDSTQSRSHSDQPPINAYTMAINQNLVTNTKEPVESQPPKRKRGRPPKPKPPEALKPKKSHPILWKFLLESLNDSTEPRRVTWVNKEDGVFRFVGNRKEEIAKQWGERKGNRKVMTYQKMARALRHYGKKEIIKKHRRRLHYRFHPKCLSKAATLSAKIARENDHSKPTDRSSVITDSHPSPEKLLQSSHTASHVMAYSRDEMIDQYA